GSAVRLLPVGPADVRGRAPRQEPAPERRGHRRRDVRQHLPLWHLSTDPPRHSSGRESVAEDHMARARTISRRSFIKVTAAVGGGLAVGVYLPGLDAPGRLAAAAGAFEPNVWVRVNADDSVRVMLTMLEMGQG